MTENCCKRLKERSDEDIRSLTNRLNRIEGQIRGIRKMIEEDRYCVDVIMQTASVTAALNSFNKELIASHIRTCVADDIRNGNNETIDELCELIQKTMK